MDSGVDMRETSHSTSSCSSRVGAYSTDSSSTTPSSNERRGGLATTTSISATATPTTPVGGVNALKLFIGQIPRFMNEADIRPIFEEFGPISDILVLRDKLTGIHKGCAFITFCKRDSAVRCQETLHEKKILPGMARPLQVKAADCERKSGDSTTSSVSPFCQY
ncbi:CUGBP Elav-like family member 4 [Echinococcus granulosus]|uniref:Bruno-like rna binding protein n=1 Tax=Echinococcus granulosus TaxID=6210 RepID=A0A068WQM3_ECHGR|nr:CUGBP Elav-like family member 4 [Echinococcus granulosus]CDS22422.1 bruno-like rna binding protein [Echinococcus granulosus]